MNSNDDLTDVHHVVLRIVREDGPIDCAEIVRRCRLGGIDEADVPAIETAFEELREQGLIEYADRIVRPTWLVGVRDEEELDANYPVEARSRREAAALVADAARVPRNLVNDDWNHNLLDREILWADLYRPLRDDPDPELKHARWPFPRQHGYDAFEWRGRRHHHQPALRAGADARDVRHFQVIAPTWLLLELDWAANVNARPLLACCSDVIGRRRRSQIRSTRAGTRTSPGTASTASISAASACTRAGACRSGASVPGSAATNAARP